MSVNILHPIVKYKNLQIHSYATLPSIRYNICKLSNKLLIKL